MLAEAGEVDVDQPAADPVQHLESAVGPALFKAVPFQTVEQRMYGTRCLFSEVIAGVPCCSTPAVPFQAAGRLSVCRDIE